MRIRFRPIQALHSVIETGTVTSAARSLGISQPAVSNLLAQLERETGLKLFTREKGRLVATREAEILNKEIDTVIRGLDNVNRVALDLKNQRLGNLSVVCIHAASFGFMTGLVAKFLEGHPDVDVSFQTRYSQTIQNWVASGLNEIGLCEMPVLDDSLIYEPFRFTCQLAIPASSHLCELEEVRPQDLDDVPFNVLGNEHMTYLRTKTLFMDANSHWRVRCQSHIFRSILEMVKAGLGVALIDPFTLRSEDGEGYVVRPFVPNVSLDLALIRPRSRVLSNIGQAFYDTLHQELSDLEEGGIQERQYVPDCP